MTLHKRHTLKTLGTLALAAAFAGGLAACSDDKSAKPVSSFKGIDLTGADYARDFSLPDTDGRLRSISEFKDKIVVVFFGFTQCPDVCPTSLQELVEVKTALGADGNRLQGIFITVDPERDTAEVLKAYMANFDPQFVALRPSPEQLAAVAKDFKIYYKKVDGKTPTSYTMDHSAANYVYDTTGRLRVYSRYGAGAKPLLEDVKTLLAERK